jgi:threonine aldolase
MEHSVLSFKNDYSEAAHPAVLEALCRDSQIQEVGYGEDRPSKRAAEALLRACGIERGEVHFVAGGTLANLVVAAAMLKPFESIIAAESGHICVHEAGAIEATGHKVHYANHLNGKISDEQVKHIVSAHNDEHMVRPRLVYISQSTELGTIYSRAEVEALAAVCREYGMLLYIDGARLSAALVSEQNDLSLAQLANLADAFYLGGTKNGALFGEAIVLRNPAPHLEFRRHLKQRGALLAKGRAVGVQFEALMNSDLHLTLARHANSMASRLAAGIRRAGYSFAYEPTTNQIFPIFSRAAVARLLTKFGFYTWAPLESDQMIIRLVTSWATKIEAVDAFIAEVEAL